MSPTDQIALVTGANKGIGFEIARQLASEHNEYHVLIGTRDPERGAKAVETLQNSGLSNVEALTLDVTSDESIASAASLVRSKFGRLDVLINNAGIFLDSSTPTRKEFEESFAVNTIGASLTTEAFVPLLKLSTSHAPRLVFVSSELGSLAYRADPTGPYNFVDAPVYRASKAALNMLALGYAHKYRGLGWKVNIHDPGYTKTDMTGYQGLGMAEEGATGAVRLATLGDDGETGMYLGKEGVQPW